MKRLLTILLLGLPLAVLAEAPANSAASTDGAQEKDPAISQMEVLAQAGIQEALKAVQRSGGFYPFAMAASGESGNLQLVGYQGDPGVKPPAEDFTVTLFLRLRQMANENPEFFAVVLMKPYHITSEEGEKVPGIWVMVDHREQRPWVMFQPLVEQEAGHYVLGQMLYQQSDEAVFPEAP